jgi:hypothetical protein
MFALLSTNVTTYIDFKYRVDCPKIKNINVMKISAPKHKFLWSLSQYFSSRFFLTALQPSRALAAFSVS